MFRNRIEFKSLIIKGGSTSHPMTGASYKSHQGRHGEVELGSSVRTGKYRTYVPCVVSLLCGGGDVLWCGVGVMIVEYL